MRITVVSYLNTLPFIYGIEQAAPKLRAGLSLQIPARCADEIIAGEADIALVPVAEIPRIPDATIITDFCIGAEGAVDTVALFSNSPIEAIRTVYLDSHSRTSVRLVRVLADELWHISPRWVEEADSLRPLADGEAVVAIGDKVFDLNRRYRYKYDLAQEWNRMTGLPFVFAAWVARTPAGREAEAELNEALRFGTEHIAQAITATENRSRDFEFESAYRYLTDSIKFNLDAPKRAALKLFWEKIITPG